MINYGPYQISPPFGGTMIGNRVTLITALLTTAFALGAAALAQIPTTDIMVMDLPAEAEGVTVVAAEDVTNLTNDDFYDNEPSFSPDGAAVYYTTEHVGRELDVFRHAFAANEEVQVTNTVESEFWPQVVPGGENIAAVVLEADGVAERLWQFGLDGSDPTVTPENVYGVEYYTFVDADTVAFILESETATGEPLRLEIVDLATGDTHEVAEPVAPMVEKVPGQEAVGFIVPSEDGNHSLSVYDLASGETRELTKTLPHVERGTFLPGGSVIAAQNNVIYRWQEGQEGWEPYLDFSETEIFGIGHIAISPDGSQLTAVFTKYLEE